MNEHLKVARQYARTVFLSIERAGLIATMRHDLNAWVEMMSNAPNTTIVNPAFNPEFSDVGPDKAFWIEVRDRDDEQIACIASKHVVTQDYLRLIRFSDLWLGGKVREFPRMVLCLPGDFPEIAGHCQHYGGLWVDKRYRGNGLSAALPRLARAIAVQRWQPRWHCGMVFEGLGKHGLPKHGYGYSNVVKCMDKQFCPLTGRNETQYLPYESDAEWYESALDQLGANVLGGGDDLVDLVTVARERQQQPVAVA